MNVSWTPDATADRHAIYDHIEAENARAAIELNDRFNQRANQLVSLPMLGRPGRVIGTRELVVHANYVMIYEIVDETIRILRVMHTAQQWPPER
jgi:addiction module RelE/StbE family toxin